MAFFTGEDEDNLKRLVDNHRVIYRRNALLSRAPHLGTHTTLRVKACTDEYVYRDPVHLPLTSDSQAEARRDMEDMAIVADWTLTPGGERRVVGSPEDPFSFVTLENQSFDVCQPICYDDTVSVDNLVGVMSRFAFGKCRVYDPLLLALYLDPSRRYVNPETQILERKAFVVRDVLIEPYGDAALLASIPTLLRTSRANWLENKVKGKRPLPFPLRLTDLGIRRVTNTKWLVWTDEFAHLTDGRNDRYGGRLVERDRPVSPSIRSRSRTAAAA
ncbi:hypothetical protein J6590_096368 [Homalodisca vitripennis]|nr:hypothetical protein J6590_096368 [Homalodisca vitripennis]